MAGRGLQVWASLGGLVFVVLGVVGSILAFDGPNSSSPAKMAAYYGNASHRTHMHIGWVLTGLGLFSLIWFVGAVRERIREAEEDAPEGMGSFLSTIVLSGGTAYIAVAMAAVAVSDGIRTMSDDTYHHQVYGGIIHAASDATYLLVVTAGAAMAAFIFAVSIAIRRFAILPRWLSWFGFVAGVAAIFSLIFFTMLFWMLWVAVASVSLFVSSRATVSRAPEAAPVPTS